MIIAHNNNKLQFQMPVLLPKISNWNTKHTIDNILLMTDIFEKKGISESLRKCHKSMWFLEKFMKKRLEI